MPSEFLISEFLVSNRYAKDTKVTYRYSLADCAEWMTRRHEDMQFAESPIIAEYLAEYASEGRPANSVSARFYVLKAYYRWLDKSGKIDRSPMAFMEPESVPKTAPNALPIEDLRAMLGVALSDGHWLLIAMLSIHSLRVTELLSFNVSDVSSNQTRTQVRFNPTSRRLPVLILAPEVADAMVRVIGHRRTGPILTNRNGDRMTRHSASSAIRFTARRAGLSYEVTPQMLAYTLPSTAIHFGFSFSGMLKSTGIPQSRHSERWLVGDQPITQDNASLRFAQILLRPEDPTEQWFSHIEHMLSDSTTPDALIVMASGAALERHLRQLCESSDVDLKTVGKDLGSMGVWVGELQRRGIVRTADRQVIDSP